MFGKKNNILNFEKNSKFAERVLLLSFPSALVFILLICLHLLTAPMAIMSYAVIIMFNVILLFPMTFELQRLRSYISSLASNDGVDIKDMVLSEQESQEIATAINQMHRFWVEKTDILTAQTMSDAAVLDTLPDPLLIIDKKQNVVGANLSARNLFGADISDKNVEMIFSSDAVRKAVNSVLSKDTDSENLVFYLDEKNKRKAYAHIKQLPWFSTAQSEAVIAVYDLSKVTKLEKMQSDFVANASHELRTPLSVISGFIETLQTTAKDDEAAREMFLKIMKEQADYMAQLIENLLSLSRIEMSSAPKPEEIIDLKDVLCDVVNSLQVKLSGKNMKIVPQYLTENTVAAADYAQMKQVMQNLIDNAIKYGNENSDIVVEFADSKKIPQARDFAVDDGEALSFSIINQGEVIKREQLDRLTERFYRLQTHRDKNIKGTGLGLSIVKQIIMRHMGNMEISSDKRKGTSFKVYIPR